MRIFELLGESRASNAQKLLGIFFGILLICGSSAIAAESTKGFPEKTQKESITQAIQKSVNVNKVLKSFKKDIDANITYDFVSQIKSFLDDPDAKPGFKAIGSAVLDFIKLSITYEQIDSLLQKSEKAEKKNIKEFIESLNPKERKTLKNEFKNSLESQRYHFLASALRLIEEKPNGVKLSNEQKLNILKNQNMEILQKLNRLKNKQDLSGLIHFGQTYKVSAFTSSTHLNYAKSSDTKGAGKNFCFTTGNFVPNQV